jgi:hypothetical protein
MSDETYRAGQRTCDFCSRRVGYTDDEERKKDKKDKERKKDKKDKERKKETDKDRKLGNKGMMMIASSHQFRYAERARCTIFSFFFFFLWVGETLCCLVHYTNQYNHHTIRSRTCELMKQNKNARGINKRFNSSLGLVGFGNVDIDR